MRISELAERYGAKPTQARYDALIEGIKASDKSIVSVVRCKECKWFDITEPSGTVEPIGYRCKRRSIFVESDDFCKRGERRESDATD